MEILLQEFEKIKIKKKIDEDGIKACEVAIKVILKVYSNKGRREISRCNFYL